MPGGRITTFGVDVDVDVDKVSAASTIDEADLTLFAADEAIEALSLTTVVIGCTTAEYPQGLRTQPPIFEPKFPMLAFLLRGLCWVAAMPAKYERLSVSAPDMEGRIAFALAPLKMAWLDVVTGELESNRLPASS
jgi:hypothetical protein